MLSERLRLRSDRTRGKVSEGDEGHSDEDRALPRHVDHTDSTKSEYTVLRAVQAIIAEPGSDLAFAALCIPGDGSTAYERNRSSRKALLDPKFNRLLSLT